MEEHQADTQQMQMQGVTKEQTDKVVKKHVLGAVGVGFIPLPLVDYAALTGLQLNMLRQLAKMYEIPFSKDKVKNLLTPLVGAAIPGLTAAPLAMSLAKFIPVIGQAAAFVTMPVLAGATTYAVGKVFVQHLASGGTFLTFDPEKVKQYYEEMFKEGQQVAADMKK